MTAPISEAELAALEAKAKAATPGPWEWKPEKTDESWGNRGPNLVSVQKAAAARAYWGPQGDAYGRKDTSDFPPSAFIITSWGHDADGIIVEPNDATFIAAASPATVLRLTADLRALREAVKHLVNAKITVDTAAVVVANEALLRLRDLLPDR